MVRSACLGRRPLQRQEKKNGSEDPPLRAPVVGALGGGAFRLGAFAADSGGADCVGDFVAGAFEGAPHVPAGDGAVGAPAFAEGQEFLGLGHMFFSVGDGPAFFDAEVVDGEDVRAAEAEDQKHFDGPGADAANGYEAFDEFLIGEFLGFFERRDDAFDGLLGQILHGKNFCAGESGLAQGGLAKLQHFLGRGCAAGGAEAFDTAEDGGGGFAGDGLVGDGFEEDLVRRLSVSDVDLERGRFCDETLQPLVACGEMLGCCGNVEGERGSCHRGE